MFSRNQKMPRGKWIALGVLWMILDQFTKMLSMEKLSFVEPTPICPGFDLILRFNTGAAFNVLAEASGWQRWFFILLAIFVMVIITYVLGKLSKQDLQEGLALSLILGGACGNLIDRIFHGYVIDFILLYYREWQWPVFNLADTFICIGAFLLIPKVLKKNY